MKCPKVIQTKRISYPVAEYNREEKLDITTVPTKVFGVFLVILLLVLSICLYEYFLPYSSARKPRTDGLK